MLEKKQQLGYQQLSSWWNQLNDEVDIGELQASICALLCWQPKASTEQLFESLNNVYELAVNEQSTALVDYVRDNILSTMGSWDFSLRLLLPQVEEVEELTRRFDNLREWCQAFNIFFMLHERHENLDELTQEAISSISKIAGFDSRQVLPEERDAELSLVQLEESVRGAVMTIFNQLHTTTNG